MNCNIIIGYKVGRLTVLQFNGTLNSKRRWLCRCDCGNTIEKTSGDLTPARNPSCGCAKLDSIKKAQASRRKDWLPFEQELLNKLKDMVKRCKSPKATGYKNYGGRGIMVCEEWSSNPRSFYKWSIKNGYYPGLAIDRINVDGNYEPSNCRYVIPLTNNNNRRTSKMIEWRGKVQSVSDWARELGFSQICLWHRFSRGWSVEAAFTTPAK